MTVAAATVPAACPRPLVGSALAAVAALAARGGDAWWPCAALEPFAPALTALALLCALWCIRRRRVPGALLALIAAASLGLPVTGTLAPPRTGPDGTSLEDATLAALSPSRVRLVLVNAWSVNPRPDVLVEWLLTTGADAVVVVELTPDLDARLAPLAARLPHRLGQARPDNFGLGVWSRFPLEDGRLLTLDGTDRPTVAARIRPGGRPLTLVAVHPPPPRHGPYHRMRTRVLDATADLVREAADPVVVVGDLNSVPWSAAFRRFTDRSGLQRAGEGFLPTWPAFLPPLWVPLDHVLTGRGVIAERVETGPFVWSDHFPLVADLVLAP